MSLLLYSQIPGTQVKRDVDLSNATIQCDPKLLFPEGASQGGVPLNKENLAGKIAVEHDICNLNVNNLTVNGVAEVCDIVCPVNFNVTAGRNVNMTADNDITLSAPGPGTGDILLTNAGAGTGAFIDLLSDDSILLRAQGTGIDLVANDGANSADVNITATRDINVDSARAIVLDSGSRGISMKFLDTSSTSNLQMTSANVNSTGANPAAQTVTANAVHGTITMLQATTIAGGAFISCTLTNNKIATNSTVLCSVNIAGNNSERIFINGGGTTAGSYEFVLTNLGASPANDYASGPNDRIVISFLVINPVV